MKTNSDKSHFLIHSESVVDFTAKINEGIIGSLSVAGRVL